MSRFSDGDDKPAPQRLIRARRDPETLPAVLEAGLTEQPTRLLPRLRAQAVEPNEQQATQLVPPDAARPQLCTRPVVGWLVIVDGPGAGHSFALTYGCLHIGRDAQQDIVLDFGDAGISRRQHAAIEYEPRERLCFLRRGDNRVYVNGERLPMGEERPLRSGDHIDIADTRLAFVAFCGESFDWNDPPLRR